MTQQDTSKGAVGTLHPECAVESLREEAVVRVWELPVRVIHWTMFVTVIVLSITGFYIGRPFLVAGAEPGFTMGWMRAIHNLAALVFMSAILGRIIWAFTGNRWARWDQFLPVSKQRRENGRATLLFYLLIRKEIPRVVGHNALAGFTYLLLFVMFLVQIMLGLALWGLQYPGSLLWDSTNWVFSLTPIPMARLIHRLIMWGIWGFVIHHVYSSWLADSEERSGLISSIFSGRKHVPTDRG